MLIGKHFVSIHVNALMPRVMKDARLVRRETQLDNNLKDPITTLAGPLLESEKDSVQTIELCDVTEEEFRQILKRKDVRIASYFADILLSEYGQHNLASKCSSIEWTNELIAKFVNNWDWTSLSANRSINWDNDLSKRFAQYIDLKELCKHPSFRLNHDIAYLREAELDWGQVSLHPSLNEFKNLTYYSEKLKWRPSPKEYEHFYTGNWLLSKTVSCNKYIEWRIEDLDLIRSKVDFWLALRNGNVSFDLLELFMNVLYESREVGIIHIEECHDTRDSHPIFSTGWENYICNDNHRISENFLNKYGSLKFKKTEYEKLCQRCEYTPYIAEFQVSKIIPPDKMDISFLFLAKNYSMFSEGYVSKEYIHPTIYNNIIYPYLRDNYALVEYLYETFLNVDDRKRWLMDLPKEHKFYGRTNCGGQHGGQTHPFNF